jgi:hypothetical protein
MYSNTGNLYEGVQSVVELGNAGDMKTHQLFGIRLQIVCIAERKMDKVHVRMN